MEEVDRLVENFVLMNEPPLHEDMKTDCLNPYSVTKVAAEDICEMYTRLYGLKTVIFRYFNVYGNRQPTKGQYAPVIGLFKKQKDNGEFVFYAMSVPSYENLALDMAELRRYIEQQKEIIIYYEKAVKDDKEKE